MTSQEQPSIVVFYHGNCPDGFGGAYAAWKKFGDTAEYIPLFRGVEPPLEAARGKEVYFIDFTYTADVMQKFVEAAKSLVALDHHEGVQADTESVPQYVYDVNRSGAGIAWDYFFPNTPRPALINHVEDDDLFRFALPDTRNVITYLEVQPRHFEQWDDVARRLDMPSEREAMFERARTYREYFEHLADIAVHRAELVQFEGHEVYLAHTHPLKSLKSYVGNKLAALKGPLALVVAPHASGLGVSLRGDGSVDVAAIAQKYGGNGHPKSAAFALPYGNPLPWKHAEKRHAS